MGEHLLHPAEAWSPQSGPQTTFANTLADVAIIGGSPGGGKSIADLYEFFKLTQLRVRRLRGVAFRRTDVALMKSGSLWDRAKEMAPSFGGLVFEESKSIVIEAHTGQIEDRHRLDFGHLHALGSERLYDGAELDVVILEELQDFDETQFWYMASRTRTTKGLRPRIRASCNAEPDIWLADLLRKGGYVGDDGYAIPAMSGVVQWIVRDEETDELRWHRSEAAALEAHPELERADLMSFTFVLARTSDNKKLRATDPGYRGRMRNLLRRDRLRLYGEGSEDRGGNWLAAEGAGTFFERDAIKFVDRPPSRVVRWVRGWDFGSIESDEPDWKKGPDWTEGARLGWTENGELWIDHVASCRLRPVATTRFVEQRAEDDGPGVVVAVFQDKGASGKRDAETTAETIEGLSIAVEIVHSDRAHAETDAATPRVRSAVRKAKSSIAKQVLAKVWARLCELGRVYASNRLSPEAKDKLRAQTYRFPNGPKDDLIDSISCGVQALDIGHVSVADAIEKAEADDAAAEARAREDERAAAERRRARRLGVPVEDEDASAAIADAMSEAPTEREPRDRGIEIVGVDEWLRRNG